MKHFLLPLFVAVTLLSACTQQPLPEADYNVIPLPKEIKLEEGQSYILDSKTLVFYEEGLQREARFLNQYVEDILGFTLGLKKGTDHAVDGIVLKVKTDETRALGRYS